MTINSNDPQRTAAALGDPRSHREIRSTKLKKGDCAVFAIETGQYGAIYFLRPRKGDELEYIAKPREVLGVQVITGERATHEIASELLQDFAGDFSLTIKKHLGKDMDGVQDVFYVLQ